MTDFNAYNIALRKLANIATGYKNDNISSIIESTLKKDKHNMLIEEAFILPSEVYNELSAFDECELNDFMEYEKELWTS